MKSLLAMLCALSILSFSVNAQGSQNFISQKLKSSDGNLSGDTYVKALPRIGINGIGNVNTETFSNINAAGKISGYIRPLKSNHSYLTTTFSFNINASNTDSLLANTFLFPDVGKSSFSFNAEYSTVRVLDTENASVFSGFAELFTKSVQGRKDDSTRHFNTLNWTIGGRYQYIYKKDKDVFSLSVSPFLSFINVPDEDNGDYRYLFTGNELSALKSEVISVGAKIVFQYNGLQFFADLRHVLGNEQSIPVRSLRGFNQNIGVVFNADFFER